MSKIHDGLTVLRRYILCAEAFPRLLEIIKICFATQELRTMNASSEPYIDIGLLRGYFARTVTIPSAPAEDISAAIILPSYTSRLAQIGTESDDAFSMA